jgi:hypothetical protein
MSTTAARRIAEPAPHSLAAKPAPLRTVAPQPIETVMHAHVYRIALGCWLVFLALFWATFWVSANALFMVVIGTFYAAMFFGVPYAMLRQVPGRTKAKGSLIAFLDRPFGTIDGALRGYEALLQVILVPLCLIAGGTAIGIIIRLARAAH